MKLLLSIILISLSFSAFGTPLFQSENPLEITIKGRFFYSERFYKKRQFKKSKKYAKGLLTYTYDGVEFNHPIEFKSRGGTRYSKCQLPPYKLKILKKENTLFAGLAKTMKLVTHCQLKDKNIQNQKVISEYLAYKFISIIYPYSFKVKLIKVNYLDENFGKITSGYGILLEHKKDLAKRYGFKVFKGKIKEQKQEYFTDDFPLDNYVRVSLANSMINNMDWGPFVNVVLVKNEAFENILVPYDFDRTGLVDDYGRITNKVKYYQESYSYFNPARFAHNSSFKYLENNITKKYQLDLGELKMLYLKHAQDIYPKRNRVFLQLEKLKNLLEPINYKLIRKRLDKFFGALNNPVNFFTREDYLKHLVTGNIEAKASAISYLASKSTDRDNDFKLIYPLYFKKENSSLKKLINRVIFNERRFGSKNATKFLVMITKKQKKKHFSIKSKAILALYFMQSH